VHAGTVTLLPFCYCEADFRVPHWLPSRLTRCTFASLAPAGLLLPSYPDRLPHFSLMLLRRKGLVVLTFLILELFLLPDANTIGHPAAGVLRALSHSRSRRFRRRQQPTAAAPVSCHSSLLLG
jgi:hypothetical protein